MSPETDTAYLNVTGTETTPTNVFITGSRFFLKYFIYIYSWFNYYF